MDLYYINQAELSVNAHSPSAKYDLRILTELVFILHGLLHKITLLNKKLSRLSIIFQCQEATKLPANPICCRRNLNHHKPMETQEHMSNIHLQQNGNDRFLLATFL